MKPTTTPTPGPTEVPTTTPSEAPTSQPTESPVELGFWAATGDYFNENYIFAAGGGLAFCLLLMFCCRHNRAAKGVTMRWETERSLKAGTPGKFPSSDWSEANSASRAVKLEPVAAFVKGTEEDTEFQKLEKELKITRMRVKLEKERLRLNEVLGMDPANEGQPGGVDKNMSGPGAANKNVSESVYVMGVAQPNLSDDEFGERLPGVAEQATDHGFGQRTDDCRPSRLSIPGNRRALENLDSGGTVGSEFVNSPKRASQLKLRYGESSGRPVGEGEHDDAEIYTDSDASSIERLATLQERENMTQRAEGPMVTGGGKIPLPSPGVSTSEAIFGSPSARTGQPGFLPPPTVLNGQLDSDETELFKRPNQGSTAGRVLTPRGSHLDIAGPGGQPPLGRQDSGGGVVETRAVGRRRFEEAAIDASTDDEEVVPIRPAAATKGGRTRGVGSIFKATKGRGGGLPPVKRRQDDAKSQHPSGGVTDDSDDDVLGGLLGATAGGGGEGQLHHLEETDSDGDVLGGGGGPGMIEL